MSKNEDLFIGLDSFTVSLIYFSATAALFTAVCCKVDFV